MYISRGVRLKFSKKKVAFFCLKIFFTFTNSVDPDKMQHYAAFHLGIHCLQKYSFRDLSKECYVFFLDFLLPVISFFNYFFPKNSFSVSFSIIKGLYSSLPSLRTLVKNNEQNT